MENQESYFYFLDIWKNVMEILFVLYIVAASLLVFAYWINYKSKKTLKQKFDLASEYEIKILRSSQFLIAFAIFFIINSRLNDIVIISIIWFTIRMFMALCFATLHGYVANLIFTYYYPGKIRARLARLRHTPRINHKTGNKMKLLSEAEEDAYLDEGMQAEENVFSVDYDVWIDEATGDTQIEKYKGHLNAHECDNCGFQTLRLVKEEVAKEATAFWDGTLNQEFNCSYCGRIKRKIVTLSYKVKDGVTSTSKLIANPLAINLEVDTIKVEIHSNKGDINIFDFQNLDQAKKFLSEFDYEKIQP